MKRNNPFFNRLQWATLMGLILFFTACTPDELLRELHEKDKTALLLPPGFHDQFAEVNGINVHYVIGGQGDPVILLHGFPQTWYEWHRIMPELAKHYTVIVPDLRGAGLTDKPAADNGYSGSLLAEDVHQLVRQLEFDSIRLVGHDIGGLAAYAYAALYSDEVAQLVMMEAFVPGIEPVYSAVLQNPATWHISFFQEENAAKIIAGDEEQFLNDFFDRFSFDPENSVSEQERAVFIKAYTGEKALRGGFAWFRGLPTSVEENLVFAQTPLTIPVLGLGGEASFGPLMQAALSPVVADTALLTTVTVPNAGHWLVEEQTEFVLEQLTQFFAETK